MTNNTIQWDEYPEEYKLLEDYQIKRFEDYMKGEYMREHGITQHTSGLNDFLKSLNKQELDIFLKIKGNTVRSYMKDKVFVEILNYCLPRTHSGMQRPILYAIYYIIENHAPSKEILIENPKEIEKIANSSNNNVNGIARSILNQLGEKFSAPVETQYFIKPDESYEFYKQFREIIKNAINYIYIVDNYSNHVIFDYIDSYCDLTKIKEIKIITEKNESDLKLAKSNFIKQYSHINVEIKKSYKSHDRYLLFDNEQWFLGPSVKDGGKKACTIVQLKDKAAKDALDTFNTIWNSAITV